MLACTGFGGADQFNDPGAAWTVGFDVLWRLLL
jgi:hypothetical protein